MIVVGRKGNVVAYQRTEIDSPEEKNWNPIRVLAMPCLGLEFPVAGFFYGHTLLLQSCCAARAGAATLPPMHFACGAQAVTRRQRCPAASEFLKEKPLSAGDEPDSDLQAKQH